MKVSDILWWCKWGVLILIVANSNKLLLFYTVSLNGTCNLSLKGNHLFLRLFDAYCKTFDCSPSFSFSTHAIMILPSLKISALESSLSFSCFFSLWCLALFARSLISRVFIDFVLSSHWLMCVSRSSPMLSENLYDFVKIISDVSSSITSNCLVWTVEKLTDPLRWRGLSLHYSDEIYGDFGSSNVLRGLAWCISAGKATLDRFGCRAAHDICFIISESSVSAEDVEGMIRSSFSMARRKVRNLSYLALALFIIVLWMEREWART